MFEYDAVTISRIYGPAKGRGIASVHGGLVYAVAYDPNLVPGITDQTRNALSFLDQTLEEAGSSKSSLLQVTVYLDDMSMKRDMDEVWCDWIGSQENWPQRACVGTDLAGNDLIEIVVTAAVLD